VQPLQRLLADVPLSGGAWLYVPPAPEGASSAQAQSAAGWQDVPPAERISSCDVEVAAPCQAVCCLTPDATQLADPAWSPFPSCLLADDAAADDAAAVPPAAAEAAAAAKRGDIAGLRMCVTDVLCAAADGADRWAASGPQLPQEPDVGSRHCFAFVCSARIFMAAIIHTIPRLPTHATHPPREPLAG
jgi:DNA polymerase delta subunit 1